MKYYKVLYRLRNGYRYSAGNMRKVMRQAYYLGKENRSRFKNGKLFVFTNLEDANKFALCTTLRGSRLGFSPVSVEIWEVECQDFTEINEAFPVWMYAYHFKNLDIIAKVRNFWLGIAQEQRLISVMSNTGITSSLKLVKKIGERGV